MINKRIGGRGPLGLVIAAGLFGAPLACGPSPDPAAKSSRNEPIAANPPAALISDQAHGGGKLGFIWIAPMVPTTPGGFSTLDQTGGSNGLTIRVDQLLADNSTTAKTSFTGSAITLVTGSSNSAFPGVVGPFYGANWTPGSGVASGQTYRVSVQALSNPTRVLGVADVQVVANATAANAVDRTKFTPLIVGGTLRIVFRLENKDTDGDGLNDWRDNCVVTKNVNQLDSNGDGIGNACQCLNVPNGTACSTGCKTGETCTAGTCGGGTAVANGTTCSTGNLCKQGETCTSGTCGGGSNKSNGTTCATGNPCKQAEICTSGTCGGGSNKTTGTACSTGNPCKQNETCTSGTCGNGSNKTTGTACSTSGNQCTTGQTCSSTGTCTGTATNKANGTACGDGNLCTQSDTCQSGVCTGATPVSCVADTCHIAGVCDKTLGVCPAPAAKTNGTACDDGNACTTGETCSTGACTGGTAVTCMADQCHSVAACVPATGCPAVVAKDDGTVCDDSNACTQFDVCWAGACAGHQVACPATTVRVRSRSNSRVSMPYGAYFADIDGDGIAEIATVTGNKLFINRAQQAGTGIGHHYFDQDVRQLVVGHFSGSPGQDLCAVLANGWFECISWVSANIGFRTWLSTTSSEASPWIQVPDLGQDIVVGDFDHNGKDDLLLYAPWSGAFQFLTVATGLGCDPTLGCGPVFTSMSNVDADSLNHFSSPNFNLTFKEVYVGAFVGSDQDDLLVLDRSNGQVYVFDGQFSAAKETFVLSDTTATGEIPVSTTSSANAWLAVANADGSSFDSLVTYTSGTGTTRFLKVVPGAAHLSDVPLLPSQLMGAAADGSRPFFGKTSNWGEQGSNVREDVYYYNAGTQQYVRSDARYSGGNTYWLAYSQNIRRFDQEVLPLRAPNPWLILMCKDPDFALVPIYGVDPFNWYFTKLGRNTLNFYNFIRDMSYGEYNYQATVQGTYVLPFGQDQSGGHRFAVWNTCVQQAGVDQSQYQHLLVTTNGADDYGQGGTGVLDAVTVVTLDGRSTPWASATAHELGHNLGLSHAFTTAPSPCGGSSDPGEYCDHLDPMGIDSEYIWDASAYPIDGPNPVNISVVIPAGYGGYDRLQLGWIPPSRQQSLVFSGVGRPGTEQTIDLAPLDRPESPGTLAAIVHISTNLDPNEYYVIDFRTKSGRWDSAVPTDGVSVRHVQIDPPNPGKGYQGYLIVTDARPSGLFQAGDDIPVEGDYEGSKFFVMKVEVVSLDAANGHAQVKLMNYP